MAIRLKANITFQPIVEEVSRKFVPREQTCRARGGAGPVNFLTQGWMGAAVRPSVRGGLGLCTRNSLVIRQNARTTAISADEQQARERFAAVVSGRNHIKRDLSQIVRVQEQWMAAKDNKTITYNGVSAYGYTFYGWIFAVQYAGKLADDSYDVNTFPTSQS